MRTVSELDKLLTDAEQELKELDLRREAVAKDIQRLKIERDSVAAFHVTAAHAETTKGAAPCPSSSLCGFAASRDKPFKTPPSPVPSSQIDRDAVTGASAPEEKIVLFRRLFRGRDDVYPRRFESAKTGKSGYQPACQNEWIKPFCKKPRIRCAECPNREFRPVTDDVVKHHLQGTDDGKSKKDFTIGVYPLLADETCRFLAADFDKKSWMDDISAVRAVCKSLNVPGAVERSRSGNGAHLWIFFSSPVPAITARQLGSFILTQAMEQRPEIGLDSYDRLFPNQDTMPKGGFGGLIALPLQKSPRQKGNSVFIDEHFQPYPDQWAFLSTIHPMQTTEVQAIAAEALRRGRVTGVKTAPDDEADEEPWLAPPSRRRHDPPLPLPLPEKITLVVANQLYISKDELTPGLTNRLTRLAAFQNPEFYKAQAMRLPTFGIPRVIDCSESFPGHIGIPRGCLGNAMELLESLGIKPLLVEERCSGEPIDCEFHGTLRPDQQSAADAMLAHDTGVLSAPTAFGKTVVAAYLIAARKVNTLVLVHRRQLLDQWVSQLGKLLGLGPGQIGCIGGGKRKVSGIIDVGIIQSLFRENVVDDLVGNYGHLLVDECHHLSARSFEAVARQCKARYVSGLSATLTRKDGHHPIIHMQCGPVRHHIDERKNAHDRPFEHRVILRKTGFVLPDVFQRREDLAIHELYSVLVEDKKRNEMIVRDVLEAVASRRFPVVLTERKEHLAVLFELLSRSASNVIVLKGGMGIKERKSAFDRLSAFADDEPRIILATGKYLGEGFDDARLDTLFLALPVSWRGVLAQYAGRLHRLHESKKEVIVYDYADLDVPMLAKMYGRRRLGYQKIGYELAE